MRLINRFDLSADEISDVYRSRWAIELFFKWLKQHVEIKHFYGMTENALQNPIFIVFNTYCLHLLVRLEVNSKQSLLRISRWLKATYGNQLICGYDVLKERQGPDFTNKVDITLALNV